MMRVATMLALALLTAACGENFDPVSALNSYRLLSVVADPERTPEGTLTAAVVDWAPEGTTPAPTRWTVCPYSLGSGVEYACLDPETVLEFEGPRLSVDLATAQFGAYTGLAAALEPAVAELNTQIAQFGGPPVTTETLLLLGFDLVIGVETGPTEQRQRSVRLVRVRASQAERCATARGLSALCQSGAAPADAPCGDADYLATAVCETPANTNPAIPLFEVVGLDGNGQAAAGSEVILKLTPGADARQTFYNDDPNALCPADDGNNTSGGPCREELYYRWYTSLGEVEESVTYESDTFVDRDTVLELPADASGTVDVFVVAYDGRGGATARRRTFAIAD